MAAYVGWVNELLDHHKNDFKKADQYAKIKNKLNDEALHPKR